MNFIIETNRVYLANEENEIIAEVTFPNTSEDTVNINHTFVDNLLRGKGIANELLKTAADYLRREHKKVIPTCSYAVKWFEEHKEYADLLAN